MSSQKLHLMDEDFMNLLARTDDSASELDGEVAAWRTAVRSYRTETLHWAERRSSTQPSLQSAARRSRFWAAVPQWSLAAVAVISIAAGVARVYDRPGDAAAADTQVTTQVAVIAGSAMRTSVADIAADNRLLSSIDQALSYQAQSPVDDFERKPAHNTRPVSTGETE